MDASRILEAVNEKKEELWQEVFGCYYAALCSYAGRLVQDPVIAEDLVQDILLYVWNGERKFLQIDELTNYLYRAVYNRSMMWLRREKCKSRHLNRLMLENDPESDEMFMATVREELLRQLYLYIDELPSEQRKVIRLSIDGLSVNEIAEKLGMGTFCPIPVSVSILPYSCYFECPVPGFPSNRRGRGKRPLKKLSVS